MKLFKQILFSLIVLTISFADIVVDQGGFGDYTTIQDAVNGAVVGSTIRVNPGTYYESVSWGSSKEFNLIGSGVESCIIVGSSYALKLNGDGASVHYNNSIQGFTLKTSNISAARGLIEISQNRYLNIDIYRCKFETSDETGIALYSTSTNSSYSHGSDINFTCSNNIFINPAEAVKVYSEYSNNYTPDPTVTFYNNIIYDTGSSYGIFWNVDTQQELYEDAMIIMFNNIMRASSGELCFTSVPQISQTIMYNNLYGGMSGNEGLEEMSLDPNFVNLDEHDFRLGEDSPCIDAGIPDSNYNDPDGSRNDMGIYGGPNSWRSLGPVITNMQVTPTVVPLGGTIQIQATGTTE